MMHAPPDPHPLFILPFALLLLGIATLPLIAARFWERHYRAFAVSLGAVSVAYYFLGLHAPHRVAATAWEYASFIVLIGSLFTVAGGIHIGVKGEATPAKNVLFLALGAIAANLIGTTGASMLLIRPWIRMNKYRFTSFHACFFIFIVSNIGGCLTPIGDPPLFLGYLKGVPFFWITVRCLPAWAFAMTTLLAIFYCIDRANFLRAPAAVRDVETAHEEFRFDGLRNVAWLALIVVAVFIKSPPGVREALMLVAAIGSWRTTPAAIHARNHFTFHPIEEVAWLFAGIFAAMMPAIDYLELHSATLGVSTPAHYFWFTGILSGLLDNAPTYLTFLAAAFGRHGLSLERADDMRAFLAAHPDHLLAISLASVFFGAITYIGNGPNFMVKTICERAKVHTPGFFGYTLKFAGPVLLPVFGCVAWWCFWR